MEMAHQAITFDQSGQLSQINKGLSKHTQNQAIFPKKNHQEIGV
jgi:hypothetical protein